MGKEIRETDRSYVPLEVATALPTRGTWDVWVDCYWSHMPGKGLIFYRKLSPQCNPNEAISRSVTEKCHPGAEVLLVPRVYVRHNCQDYA